MRSLLWPGAIALLFGFLFLVSAGIFLLALQYRKHGRLSWRRTITSMVVVTYVFALVSYTMLPLPETRDAFCRPGVAETQLVPFKFLEDFKLAYEFGRRSFLTSFALWQVLFNVLLFIPVGILAVRWARGNIFSATFIGFLLTLCIELTQYTGIWGIYTCAYRVADVDDIMLNTFGALLGAILAYLPFFAWLSAPDERDAANQPPREVTRSRRALANLFDLAFITALVMAVTLVIEVAERLGVAGAATAGKLQGLVPIVAVLVVIMLPTLAAGRASLGQRCAWFQVTGPNGLPASAGRALARSIVGLGGLSILNTLLGSDGMPNSPNGMAFPVLLLALASCVALLLDRHARGLSGRITGTSFTDRRGTEDHGARAMKRG